MTWNFSKSLFFFLEGKIKLTFSENVGLLNESIVLFVIVVEVIIGNSLRRF